jgi:transcriptional pleiotropic regulator of transition state genes
MLTKKAISGIIIISIKMKWRKIMKSTGVVRRIDELGRIVLPIEIRKNLNIGNRDTVEIFVEEDKIILKKYEPACIFCGNADNVVLFNGKLVCRDCIEKLKNN